MWTHTSQFRALGGQLAARRGRNLEEREKKRDELTWRAHHGTQRKDPVDLTRKHTHNDRACDRQLKQSISAFLEALGYKTRTTQSGHGVGWELRVPLLWVPRDVVIARQSQTRHLYRDCYPHRHSYHHRDRRDIYRLHTIPFFQIMASVNPLAWPGPRLRNAGGSSRAPVQDGAVGPRGQAAAEAR